MEPYSLNPRAEALRWLGIAEKLLTTRDLVGSKTFATRARDSDPRLELADQILAIVDTLLAGEKQISNYHLDWYAILQLPRSTHDSELVAAQYRRLALLLNPNRNNFPFADHAFKLVSEAWLVLSNPSRKFQFDNEFGNYNSTHFNFIQQEHSEQHHLQPSPQQQHEQQPLPPQQQPWNQPVRRSPHEQQLLPQQQQSLSNQPQTVRRNLHEQQLLPQQHLNQPQTVRRNLHEQQLLPQQHLNQPQTVRQRPHEQHPLPQQQQPPSPQLQTVRRSPLEQQPLNQQQPTPPPQPQMVRRSPLEQQQPPSPQWQTVRRSPLEQQPLPQQQQPSNQQQQPSPQSQQQAEGESPGNCNNVTEEESGDNNTTTNDLNREEALSFWTACPYCYNMYEYPGVYAECILRCQNCKRAFHAVTIAAPPPISDGKEAYFCCWGFFPLGISMSNMEKNKGGGSNWTPFSPMFTCPQGASNVNVGKPKNAGKNSGPRIYIDDDHDVFVALSSSEDSDDEWGSTRKKKKAKSGKGRGSATKNVKQSLVDKAKNVKRANGGNSQGGFVPQEGGGVGVPNVPVSNVPVGETSKKAVGITTRRQSGRVAKDLGKLDLNVEFSNEVEEPAPGTSGGNRAGNGEEDNIEGIGFFEGLDEFLSNLPILSVVGDDKVKAG